MNIDIEAHFEALEGNLKYNKGNNTPNDPSVSLLQELQ